MYYKNRVLINIDNQIIYLLRALSSDNTANLVSKFLIFYLYPFNAPSLLSVSYDYN